MSLVVEEFNPLGGNVMTQDPTRCYCTDCKDPLGTWDGTPDGNEPVGCTWCGMIAYWTEGEDADRFDIGGQAVCKACHEENANE
jgi:hypothetical protein